MWALTTAERHALDLVRSLLHPADLERLLGGGYLIVPSRLHPGRDYYLSLNGQVRIQRGERYLAHLCIYPCEQLPWPDAILAHVLLLEGDEERYLHTANVLSYGMFTDAQDTDLLPFNRWS